jgi:hypothetical protein
LSKKSSKSCQKVVKVVKKLYKFKTSGEEEEEEEEEDCWLQDQVATSSHLVKRQTARWRAKIGSSKPQLPCKHNKSVKWQP